MRRVRGYPCDVLLHLHMLTVEGYMQVKIMPPLQQWVVIAVLSASIV